MRIFEDASGVITVFDCSVPAKENARSLAALDQWYSAFADYIADGLPMILVGNKCDAGPCTISPQSLDMVRIHGLKRKSLNSFLCCLSSVCTAMWLHVMEAHDSEKRYVIMCQTCIRLEADVNDLAQAHQSKKQ